METMAGPRLRAGFVLVPEIADSSGTRIAYRNGITNGVNRRTSRRPRKTQRVATSAKVAATSPRTTAGIE